MVVGTRGSHTILLQGSVKYGNGMVHVVILYRYILYNLAEGQRACSPEYLRVWQNTLLRTRTHYNGILCDWRRRFLLLHRQNHTAYLCHNITQISCMVIVMTLDGGG